jgi:hypothetical protein
MFDNFISRSAKLYTLPGKRNSRPATAQRKSISAGTRAVIPVVIQRINLTFLSRLRQLEFSPYRPNHKMPRGLVMSLAQAEAHQVKHGFAFQPQIVPPSETAKVQKLRRGKQMNATESAYSLILEAMKRRGDIADYKFEGLTLRLADDCRYTPDFFIIVARDPLQIRFAETKGAHIWDDSKVKFRVAKEQNPWAEWEMHQKIKCDWSRII